MERSRKKGVSPRGRRKGLKVIVLILHPQGLWVIGSLIRVYRSSLGQSWPRTSLKLYPFPPVRVICTLS